MKTEMLLNSNLALTLGYLNPPALNNSAQVAITASQHICSHLCLELLPRMSGMHRMQSDRGHFDLLLTHKLHVLMYVLLDTNLVKQLTLAVM